MHDMGQTLARVSAICTLLADPRAIPDDLESSLYAYAGELIKSHGEALADLHDAYMGYATYSDVVMDIIRANADIGE